MSDNKQQFHVVVTKEIVEAAKPTLTSVHTLLTEQAFERLAAERWNQTLWHRVIEDLQTFFFLYLITEYYSKFVNSESFSDRVFLSLSFSASQESSYFSISSNPKLSRDGWGQNSLRDQANMSTAL